MTPEDEEFERIAQRQLAALKKATKAIVEDAAVRAAHKVMAEFDVAQPEQEPVAWMTPTGALYRTKDVDGCFDDTHIPLYATPPQRKPLTDEQIIQIASTPDGSKATTKGYVIPFARAIEAAHGIKGEA